MTTGNTALLGLALPVNGELDGTWGTVVNNEITSLVDSAVAGTTILSVDSDVTLTDTALVANQARQAVILWTASNGATTRNITAPARSKAYIVINAGTGSIVIRGSGPTTGVTLPAGTKALVAWNGSDFVKVASNPAVLTTDVSGILPIANGGTGTSSTTFTNLTTNVTGTLPVANGGTGVTTSTGTGNVVLSNSPTLVTPALGTPSSATLTNATGLPISAGTTGILPVDRGGSGTATPALVAGSNITITGTWPNQTIAAAAPGTGTVTSVAGTGSANGLSLSGTVTSSGNITLGGSVTSLTTTNFTIEESGGKLVFKYGATVIASMDSTGVFTTLSDITANGTP